MNFRKFIESVDVNFDNFREKLPEVVAALKADPQAMRELGTTGNIATSTISRVTGVTLSGLLSVLSMRISDELHRTPEYIAFDQAKQQREKLEREDDYLYHVTINRNLPGIKSKGLIPGARSNFDGFYKDYSAGKIFLCERGAVQYWIDKLEENQNVQGVRISKPVVVRIPKVNVRGLENDAAGTRDSRHPCYYLTTAIPANQIEVIRNFK